MNILVMVYRASQTYVKMRLARGIAVVDVEVVVVRMRKKFEACSHKHDHRAAWQPLPP